MRLARAIVIDPDENVPVAKRVVYDSAEQFTDSTDEEMFFEEAIVRSVKAHNKYRLTLKDKYDKKLEVVRLRDLVKGVVVTANFEKAGY